MLWLYNFCIMAVMNDNKIRHIGKLSRQGLNSLGRFSNDNRGGEKKSKISFNKLKLNPTAEAVSKPKPKPKTKTKIKSKAKLTVKKV